MPCREESPYTICFAITCRLLIATSSVTSSCFLPLCGFFFVPPSMTASTSSSRMMRYSSPSSLTSWLVYLPKRIRSPALTSRGTRLPSSFTLPLPAAMTLPCCGFSLAVSGMMIPPIFCSPSSRRRTMSRSCSGLIVHGCRLQMNVNGWIRLGRVRKSPAAVIFALVQTPRSGPAGSAWRSCWPMSTIASEAVGCRSGQCLPTTRDRREPSQAA